MDEVIEISSSPEPVKRSSRDPQSKTRRPKLARQRSQTRIPVVGGDDVIELTDSDDDTEVYKSASRLKSKTPVKVAQREPKAGSSRPATQLFGSPRQNLLSDGSVQAGSSAAAANSRANHQGIPLFLPDDAEEDPAQPVSHRAAPH